MFYFDLYIINVYVILPPDLGPFAVNKYIHTYNSKIHYRIHNNLAPVPILSQMSPVQTHPLNFFNTFSYYLLIYIQMFRLSTKILSVLLISDK
jgi:hypothetical protein